MTRRILCYGDSNTYGYDPRSYLGERYPESVRWTALLAAEGWDVRNEGANGRTIPRKDWEIEAALQTIRGQEPDTAIVMLGTNDLLQDPGLSARECAGRMERFLSSLIQESSACKYLLVFPPPMTTGAWVQDAGTLARSRQLAGYYAETAHRLGIAYADAGGWNISLLYDGVHFSPDGHQAFADGIKETLAGLRF